MSRSRNILGRCCEAIVLRSRQSRRRSMIPAAFSIRCSCWHSISSLNLVFVSHDARTALPPTCGSLANIIPPQHPLGPLPRDSPDPASSKIIRMHDLFVCLVDLLITTQILIVIFSPSAVITADLNLIFISRSVTC